jgi:hypothetical protein
MTKQPSTASGVTASPSMKRPTSGVQQQKSLDAYFTDRRTSSQPSTDKATQSPVNTQTAGDENAANTIVQAREGKWNDIFKGGAQTKRARVDTVRCSGHNVSGQRVFHASLHRLQEVCSQQTVKKAGPNRGRQFLVCARGTGAKGDKEARCDFFKWVT